MSRIQLANHTVRFVRFAIGLLLIIAGVLLPMTAQASTLLSGPAKDDHRCYTHYTVHHGDTLSMIAASYGVNVYTLAQTNGIYNVNQIYSGQYLCIPDHDAPHGDDGGHGNDGMHGQDDCYGMDKHDQDHKDYARHGQGDCNGNDGRDGMHGKDDCYGHDRHCAMSGDGDGYHQQATGYYYSDDGYSKVCYYPDPRTESHGRYYEDDANVVCR